jgi:hypothetical protein
MDSKFIIAAIFSTISSASVAMSPATREQIFCGSQLAFTGKIVEVSNLSPCNNPYLTFCLSGHEMTMKMEIGDVIADASTTNSETLQKGFFLTTTASLPDFESYYLKLSKNSIPTLDSVQGYFVGKEFVFSGKWLNPNQLSQLKIYIEGKDWAEKLVKTWPRCLNRS